MLKKGLTLSIIFEAESANYGEGFGNITVLKKINRSDRNQYSYISRQALRYNMMQQLNWDNTPVDGKSGVVQFAPEATIEQYPEIDLFGYLKTSAKGDTGTDKGTSNKRAAVVRLSNAISLENYNGDMDFLNNMGLAARTEKDSDNALAQSEIHKSMYTYTITIDLDKVGIDGNINIPDKVKAERIIDFLDTVQFLYRDIKGRRENLNPIFAIGGLYQRKNPYFENRLRLTDNKLKVSIIEEILKSSEDVKENTSVSYIGSMFNNDQEIKEKLNPVSISDMFAKLKKEVAEYYG